MSNRLPHLSCRLALTASFVRKGAKVADIGTDHAYLPVYLVNAGIAPCAIASDIRSGPLDRAVLTARKYCAEDSVSFALADGLDGIEPAKADDIVIAGMGGGLISSVIGRCGWLSDPAKHLVLQPMTAQEELRSFLCENGYAIEKEAVACEKSGRKLYLVISASYCGKKRKEDKLYSFVGELQNTGGAQARAYLEFKARLLIKKARGLGMSEDGQKEAEEVRSLALKILEISKAMKI